jgi:hypothetical protein
VSQVHTNISYSAIANGGAIVVFYTRIKPTLSAYRNLLCGSTIAVIKVGEKAKMQSFFSYSKAENENLLRVGWVDGNRKNSSGGGY